MFESFWNKAEKVIELRVRVKQNAKIRLFRVYSLLVIVTDKNSQTDYDIYINVDV